jgi:uncharacterized protein
VAWINDMQSLRAIVGEPKKASVEKDRSRLDKYDRRFLSLSPFLCLGTSGAGGVEVSVRGDQPGFVRVMDDVTIFIPERPGNRRADTMGNLLSDPRMGLIFFVPGVDETLRMTGRARIVDDPELLAGTEVNGRPAKLGLLVHVERVFFHCGKAVIRSDLWGGKFEIDRSEFPPLAQILRDQRWGGELADIQAEIDDSYQNRLY